MYNFVNIQTFFQTYIYKLFSKLFRKNFASLKIPVISKKFLNLKNQTFPTLAKTKSSEISVQCRALEKDYIDEREDYKEHY